MKYQYEYPVARRWNYPTLPYFSQNDVNAWQHAFYLKILISPEHIAFTNLLLPFTIWRLFPRFMYQKVAVFRTIIRWRHVNCGRIALTFGPSFFCNFGYRFDVNEPSVWVAGQPQRSTEANASRPWPENKSKSSVYRRELLACKAHKTIENFWFAP